MSAINEQVIKAAITVILLSGLLFMSAVSLHQHLSFKSINHVTDQDLPARGQAMLAGTSATPISRIELAERLIAAGPENDTLARELLLSAIERDAYQPYAWTQIAFLETRQAGHFNAAAQDAFSRSLEQCPLCDEDLLKWRLTFMLANWDEVPQDMRLQVFTGADLLRWWHLNYGYLDQMRQSAEMNNIPFAEYQRMIATPVRPEELEIIP